MIERPTEILDAVAVRFAGDSGDGMQLTGTQFTETTAIAGNDLATFPDFPAEIRAPAGSLAGVSGFQVHYSSQEVFTPGDEPDVLIAMNPAALKVNLADLKKGGILILNSEQFTTKNLERVGYASNPIEPGRYKNITGNEATALGFLAAAELSGLELFLGSYPITPASDILHALSRQKHLGVKTFQAEDEIAAIGAVFGAAYAGGLGLTTTSGPGVALKSEAMNLGIMLELPFVIADVQRGGPSTGLPTKTEQSDLLQVMYGRNGESPIPVVAAAGPGDCFYAAIEACRIAIESMTPVVFLSDGYVANGAEPWRIPQMSDLPKIPVVFHTQAEGFKPYDRDEKLSRPWAVPGTPGLEHRIGGLEKQNITGNISYDPNNHDAMVRLRAEKVRRIADRLPPTTIHGDPDGKVLVVGWGGTFGALRAGVEKVRALGHRVGHVHLRHLNPFPNDLGESLDRYEQVLVPELNLGQLLMMLRARYLVNAHGLNKVQGKPFKESEIVRAILARLEA